MQSAATADGGRGTDFRQGVGFASGSKVRAKDFETEAVLAETLRFLFGRARRAPEVFGETREALRAKLAPGALPEAYHELARALRASWEESSAAGSESRSFGKAMLDQCQAWHRAFKADPSARDAALSELLAAPGIASASAASPPQAAEVTTSADFDPVSEGEDEDALEVSPPALLLAEC